MSKNREFHLHNINAQLKVSVRHKVEMKFLFSCICNELSVKFGVYSFHAERRKVDVKKFLKSFQFHFSIYN